MRLWQYIRVYYWIHLSHYVCISFQKKIWLVAGETWKYSREKWYLSYTCVRHTSSFSFADLLIRLLNNVDGFWQRKGSSTRYAINHRFCCFSIVLNALIKHRFLLSIYITENFTWCWLAFGRYYKQNTHNREEEGLPYRLGTHHPFLNSYWHY